MKFQIYWSETHNPMNWTDKNDYRDGLKQIKVSFPNAIIRHNDGKSVRIFCRDKFEAKGIKEAKKYVKEIYNCEVFIVYIIGHCFTEKDL